MAELILFDFKCGKKLAETKVSGATTKNVPTLPGPSGKPITVRLLRFLERLDSEQQLVMEAIAAAIMRGAM